MKKLLIISAIALSLVSCKSGGWADSQKDDFKKKCNEGLGGSFESGVAKKYCDCVLDKAMKDYKSAEDLEKAGQEAATKVAMSCASELLPK